MSKRKSNDQFVIELAKVNPNIIPLAEYKNSKTKLRVKCVECNNVWDATPNSLLRGIGCPKCSYRENGIKSRKTNEQFIIELSERNPTVIPLTEYNSSRSKIKVQCSVCNHAWEAAPETLLKGIGCPKCSYKNRAQKKRKTNQEFLGDLKKINPDIIPLEPYIDAKTKIRVTTNHCNHIWYSSPNSLLSGNGCWKCARKEIGKKQTLTNEVFLKKLSEVNPFITPLEDYKKSNEAIKVCCSICGTEWETKPNYLLEGAGCPSCRISNREKRNREEFYDKLTKVNPNLEPLEEYSGFDKTIRVHCKKCNSDWKDTPISLLRGKQCPICQALVHSQQYIEKLSVANPNIEVIGGFKNYQTKIAVKCKTCGNEWEDYPKQLLEGRMCPECKKRSNTYAFREKLSKINPLVQVQGDYKDTKTKILVKCKVCGNEWYAEPYTLLNGGGCTNCTKPHSSFMEQFLLIALRKSLGETSVLSRDTDTIGKELDILIPSHNYAIEIGSWYYHKKTQEKDKLKRIECQKQGIKLVTIFDAYPSKSPAPFNTNCFVFEGQLNEDGHKRLIELTKTIIADLGKSSEGIDWSAVVAQAYKERHYDGHDLFVKKLKLVAPDIEVIGSFSGTKNKIQVKHSTCGYVWETIPKSLLNGHGCPNCANNQRKSNHQFIAELSKRCPSVKVVGEYRGTSRKITVCCLKCGYTWDASPSHLLNGHACPVCGGNKKKSNDDFAKQLEAKNPNLILLGDYKNNKEAVRLKCLKCNYSWTQRPDSLFRSGCKCKNCKE